MSKKPVLICGFPRSGTTMLYFWMLECLSDRTLYEPCNIQVLGWYRQYTLFKELDYHLKHKTHPYFSKKISKLVEPYIKFFKFDELFNHYLRYYPGNGFFKDYDKLKPFLKLFRNYNMKDVSLHFYLHERFIKEWWDVYFIIRHPVDVYMSMLKSSQPDLRFKNLMLTFFPKSFYYKLSRSRGDRYIIDILYIISKERPQNSEEKFLLLWTLTNYYALKHIPTKRVITYNDIRTYDKLPFEIPKNKIKVKRYPRARERYEKTFRKLSENLGIIDMYDYVFGRLYE